MQALVVGREGSAPSLINGLERTQALYILELAVDRSGSVVVKPRSRCVEQVYPAQWCKPTSTVVQAQFDRQRVAPLSNRSSLSGIS